MTLGECFRELRRELGLTQEAIGAAGFVSTPGWIKIENGQRDPSEKLIAALRDWLVRSRKCTVGAGNKLHEELLTLKYLGGRSGFLRQLAEGYARAHGLAHLLTSSPVAKPKRGRPRK